MENNVIECSPEKFEKLVKEFVPERVLGKKTIIPHILFGKWAIQYKPKTEDLSKLDKDELSARASKSAIMIASGQSENVDYEKELVYELFPFYFSSHVPKVEEFKHYIAEKRYLLLDYHFPTIADIDISAELTDATPVVGFEIEVYKAGVGVDIYKQVRKDCEALKARAGINSELKEAKQTLRDVQAEKEQLQKEIAELKAEREKASQPSDSEGVVKNNRPTPKVHT